jgi:hypothetical protein
LAGVLFSSLTLNDDITSYKNGCSVAKMEVEEKEGFIVVSSHKAPAACDDIE